MVGCAAVGTVTALVPDVIEPALTPNHRGLAHSVATGSALLRLAYELSCAENQAWEEFQKILFASAAAGYVSHLVADGCTPQRLPLWT